MKLWMKYTFSACLGILLAFFLPENQILDIIIRAVAEFSLRAGRFLVFPLAFFTLTVSVCQLRRDQRLGKVILKLLVLTSAAAGIYTLLAEGMSVIIPVNRIPILSDSTGWLSGIPFRNEQFHPGFSEYLRQLLPVNAFQIFRQSADFILPALIFAFILGTQLFHDMEEGEPVYNLFDSFSRMFYRMNTLFTRLLVLTLFSLSYESLNHIRRISDFSSYFSLIRLVLLATLIILTVVQPLAYFIITRKNPFREMRAFLPGIIVSLFSGDNFVNMLVMTRVLKENSGMKRKVSGLVLPFLTLFSRAGSALIAAISMLTILKSYSSLELTAFQIFWVIGISILVSFILFSQSYMGIYTALITACTLYGRGLQDGYVLILPVLPFLLLIAGLLDASNTAYLTLLFNDDREFRIPEDPEDFI
ncbi:cation:dicarboxylase symporter family transporter [Oceanispirochaeta sp.]|jgi:aerobic C4-dicarboxylate transport protein|uniref:dicarboxylate/amino acid:cation symporter n=1 Tax=Oceanispirochaeta sp. TaxID=2035350 RepID=UPI002604E83F|nr:cation:dicarboxylase symporter family transporter [Oceanispirochaeta sp.]MDA3956452.1 cation:dicarboxylase symporter family transporter [Oceanispirochaeta sp.]